jgi:flagellar hook-associated protein 2
MAGTITFGGIGSGMDVEGLISGLMNVERQGLSRIQSRQAAADSAVTDLSNLSGLLSTLKNAATSLDTLQEVGSYKTTSSNTDALALTANGNAQPGSYKVEVKNLASSARRYSDTFSSASTALGQSGQLTFKIGPNGTPIALDVDPADSLDAVIQKINGSGLRLQASAFFDGTAYRMSVRGLDTGDANVLEVNGSVDFGLNKTENIISQASDAEITVDGFTVKSASNQLNQAIPGVNLALKAKTDKPFDISVAEDPEGLSKKLTSFVDGYNAVVNKIHSLAGSGKIKATNPLLAGDGALRSIAGRLSSTLTKTIGSGAQNSLASIGIQLNNDGTLRLDQTKLGKALTADPKAVSTLLSGDDATSTKGMMDTFRELAEAITDPSKGEVASRSDGLRSQSRRYADSLARENDRMAKLEQRLRTTFTQMDSSVAASNATLSSLQKL